MNNLQGLSILVTRTAPAGSALCTAISALGGKAHWLPTIAIIPPPQPENLLADVKKFSKADILIFVSSHAVSAIAAFIKTYPPDLSGVQLICIGAGTKAQLAKLFPDKAIICPQIATSEGLLALPLLNQVKQKTIMLVKGLGGRHLLADTLRERGALLSTVIAYQRMLPQVTDNDLQVQRNDIDVMVCGSFESLENLVQIFKDHASLRNIPVIVLSDRVKALAQDLGFQTIWVAQNASDQAIIEVLLRKKDSLWQMKQLPNQK